MTRIVFALVGFAGCSLVKYCAARMLEKEMTRYIDKKVAESHAPAN